MRHWIVTVVCNMLYSALFDLNYCITLCSLECRSPWVGHSFNKLGATSFSRNLMDVHNRFVQSRQFFYTFPWRLPFAFPLPKPKNLSSRGGSIPNRQFQLHFQIYSLPRQDTTNRGRIVKTVECSRLTERLFMLVSGNYPSYFKRVSSSVICGTTTLQLVWHHNSICKVGRGTNTPIATPVFTVVSVTMGFGHW